jgi:hypothetical protein
MNRSRELDSVTWFRNRYWTGLRIQSEHLDLLTRFWEPELDRVEDLNMMTRFKKRLLDRVEEIQFDKSGSGFGNLVGQTGFEARWAGSMSVPV